MQLLSLRHVFSPVRQKLLLKTGKTDIFLEHRLFSEIAGFSSDSETDAFYELSDTENL